MKEWAARRTTWESESKLLNRYFLDGLLKAAPELCVALVTPWAAQTELLTFLLGLGQVLGVLQTVVIHQATPSAGGHIWIAWCGMASLQSLRPDAFSSSVCPALPHTLGGHVKDPSVRKLTST